MSAMHEYDDNVSPAQVGHNQQEEPDPGTLRNFSMFLQNLEDGELHHELTRDIENIIETLSNHVLDHGGKPKAKISLGIEVTLDGGELRILPTKTLKLPTAPRRTTTMWANKRNQATLANPKQQRMFNHGVRDDAPVRTISDE